MFTGSIYNTLLRICVVFSLLTGPLYCYSQNHRANTMDRGSRSGMVEPPRFILKYAPVDGGYRFTAECIDAEALEDFMGSGRSLDYLWGVKRQGGNIEWRKSESPGLFVADESPASRIWVYFKTVDDEGTESPVQTLATDERIIFFNSDWNTLLTISDSEKIYSPNGTYMYYRNGMVRYIYFVGMEKEYYVRPWAPLAAHVISPFQSVETELIRISISNGFPVSKILPSDQYSYLKGNLREGEVRFYMLMFINLRDELLQYLPLMFTYKQTI